MAFPGRFHRLVVAGSVYDETFNFSLSIVPSDEGLVGLPPVDAALLAEVAGVVGSWFPLTGTSGVGFVSAVQLESIKLNDIGPDGHYVQDVTWEHVYPSPIAGTQAGTPAPQTTMVVSLLTAAERGLASKGRFYLPPIANQLLLQSDGRLLATTATSIANGAKALINSLNTAYADASTGDEAVGKVGVASDTRTGMFRVVTGVGVGRVVDTMRSRRGSLLEERVSVTVP